MKKTAVILFNLGGPDKKEAIRPFLRNFFMDPAIVGAPWPVRWLLAKYISVKRTKKEAGDSYERLGYKSPLLENSEAQAAALEKELNMKGEGKNKSYRCFVSMRYWHPRAKAVAGAVKEYGPDEIFLLPLYPQFSTTTTGSSLKEWHKEAGRAGVAPVPVRTVCCYPLDEGFVGASAKIIRQDYDKLSKEAEKKSLPAPRILFSAHGLPEKIIKAGDPYQWQCENTARRIVEKLAIEGLDWQICYQSRVGPLKWIGPSTDEAIKRAGEDGVPVLVYPHAFVSEHVETLVEIDEEYRQEAQKYGVPLFEKIDTVGTHADFIAGLAALVTGQDRGRICPQGYTKCCRAGEQQKQGKGTR